jgi:hypothetical protein
MRKCRSQLSVGDEIAPVMAMPDGHMLTTVRVARVACDADPVARRGAGDPPEQEHVCCKN